MKIIEGRPWLLYFGLILIGIIFVLTVYPYLSGTEAAKRNTDIACEWCEEYSGEYDDCYPCVCSWAASMCVYKYKEVHNLTSEKFPCYIYSNDMRGGWIE